MLNWSYYLLQVVVHAVDKLLLTLTLWMLSCYLSCNICNFLFRCLSNLEFHNFRLTEAVYLAHWLRIGLSDLLLLPLWRLFAVMAIHTLKPGFH